MGVRLVDPTMQGPPNNNWPQQPPYPPQQQPYQQQQQQHDYGRGQFDLGGGHHLQVKIDGKTPENYAKDKVSGMIWGWIIGAVILGIVVLTVVGFGIYIYVVAKDDSSPASKAATAAAANWDGKSTLECKGNDVMTVSGVTATVSDTAIRATGNCQLVLTNVKITAPVGIEAGASAKVTMTGGSITSSTNSVVASANSNVVITGAQVSGKSKKSGNAKIVGAP